MEKYQSRTHALHPPIAPPSLQVSKEMGFELRKMGLNQGFYLLRYFLTKSLWREESLEFYEEVSLHLLCLWFESVKVPTFIGKHYKRWLSLKIVIPIWRKGAADTTWGKATLKLLHKNNEVFISPRAYLGQEKFSQDKLLKRINRALRPNPRPKRWIGVGYRDKGNARLIHQDGSPSWEEVIAGKPDAEREKLLDSALWVRIRGGPTFPIVPTSAVPFGPVRYVNVG
jgi:hypothetical protein